MTYAASILHAAIAATYGCEAIFHGHGLPAGLLCGLYLGLALLEMGLHKGQSTGTT